jgi:hypothetical protein
MTDTNDNKWTEEEMHLLNMLQWSLKENSSHTFEYEKDENGDYVKPMKVTRSYYKYITITENLEVDTYGMILRPDKDMTYAFCYPHLRNTVHVDRSFLANILKSIRSYILDNLIEAKWTAEKIMQIPPSVKIMIPSVVVDPGMVHHHEGHQRNAGVRIGAIQIWHNDFPRNIEPLLNGGIHLRTLLANPDEYYQELDVPNIEPINQLLGQFKAQKNKLKRLQYINNTLLKTKGNFTFEVELFEYIRGLNIEKGQGTYEYRGVLPILAYNIQHDPNENGKIKGDWDFPVFSLTIEKGEEPTFVLHIPEEFRKNLESDNNSDSNKERIIGDFKESMNLKFGKLDIVIDCWRKINFEFVYDA